MEAFTNEVLDDPSVIDLTKKVTVEEDGLMTAAFPKETIATVSLRLKDGSVHEGKSILPKGEPENPLSDEEVFEKFKRLALYGGKTHESAERIIDAAMSVESELPELLDLLK